VGSCEHGNEPGGSIKDTITAKGDMYFPVQYFRGAGASPYIRAYMVICVMNANVNRVNYNGMQPIPAAVLSKA
jgi:hypothetical protein